VDVEEGRGREAADFFFFFQLKARALLVPINPTWSGFQVSLHYYHRPKPDRGPGVAHPFGDDYAIFDNQSGVSFVRDASLLRNIRALPHPVEVGGVKDDPDPLRADYDGDLSLASVTGLRTRARRACMSSSKHTSVTLPASCSTSITGGIN
jgi:hypothetical protein